MCVFADTVADPKVPPLILDQTKAQREDLYSRGFDFATSANHARN